MRRVAYCLVVTLLGLSCTLSNAATSPPPPTAAPPGTQTASPTVLAPTAALATATRAIVTPRPTETGTPLPTATPPAPTATPALAPQTIKIMPLGDSITFGTPDLSYGGYRHLLGTLLGSDGYHIDFVGSQRSGTGVIPDPDNEGHYGWNITQIRAGIDSKGWLEAYQPDLILLHIGTNDMHQPDPASAPGKLSALLDDILGRLPRTKVIVAQIIPFRTGADPAHQSYNAALPGIVASKGPRVTLVDMQTILTAADYADRLHPNASGYDKMARAWEPAIRAVISSNGSQP